MPSEPLKPLLHLYWGENYFLYILKNDCTQILMDYLPEQQHNLFQKILCHKILLCERLNIYKVFYLYLFQNPQKQLSHLQNML